MYELEGSFGVSVLILCDTNVAAIQPFLIGANAHLAAEHAVYIWANNKKWLIGPSEPLLNSVTIK